MFALIAVGTVIFFWTIDLLNSQTENKMSFIKEVHQQELIDYGREAERLFKLDDLQELSNWLEDLQAKESTWAAVVQSPIIPLANSTLAKRFTEQHRLGRSVKWKIHLYFKENPTMEVTFTDKKTRFLILLPQRMRPGGYYPAIQVLLQIALPFIILSLLSWLLYRHVMKPLSALKKATQQFSDGEYDIQLNSKRYSRQDELTTLADSFDQMASRIGKLIVNQRQLLEHLSHELRTPLARLDMALESVKQGIQTSDSIERLSSESVVMRELVEDTLMLVWLNNESPVLNKDSFDLTDLIEVICNDARFEYPKHRLVLNQPEQLLVTNSSHRALAHAIENIIRNALQYSCEQQQVNVSSKQEKAYYQIFVQDQGPGVPSHLLKDIFQPFFRVDKERARKEKALPIATGVRRGGFGLGLALAQRQVRAIGGEIIANNLYAESDKKILGLKITINIPL